MAVGQLIMVECKLEQKYDLIMAGNKNVTSDSPKAIKTDRICWPTLWLIFFKLINASNPIFGYFQPLASAILWLHFSQGI